MRHFYLLTCVVCILLLTAATNKEVTQSSKIKVIKSVQTIPQEHKVAPRAINNAYGKRIAELRQKAEEQIKAIEREIEATKDKSKEPELQKQIHNIKTETEIEVLKIKLEIAKRRGDDELVNEIEQALNNLRNPSKYKVKTAIPIRRSVPETRIDRQEEIIKEKIFPSTQLPKKLDNQQRKQVVEKKRTSSIKSVGKEVKKGR